MGQQEYSTAEKIKGALFVIWFFGSIIAMVLFAKTTPFMTLTVFGQVFFISGILVLIDGFKKKNFKPLFLLFIVVGALTGIYGVVLTYGDHDTQKKFTGMAVYVALGVFFITGLLCLFSVVWRNAVEANCTYPVKAVCIDLKKHRSYNDVGDQIHERRYTYCPVFSFDYRGKIYEVCHYEYTNNINVHPGKEYDLYINPNHPYIFREQHETARLNGNNILLGIFFIVGSVVAFLFV